MITKKIKILSAYLLAACAITGGSIYYKYHIVDFVNVKQIDSIPGSFTIGNKDAPNTLEIIESTTCSHCQAWSQQYLPMIRQKYVDTGKWKLVIHDFPRDTRDLWATALTQCLPENKKADTNLLLLKTYTQWATLPIDEDAQNKILDIAQLKGQEREDMHKCMISPEKKKEIMDERSAIMNTYPLQATPTFILPPHMYTAWTEKNSKEIMDIMGSK